MGKMLAFLTILRKNINIIIIQICTSGPSSFTALQWSLSSSDPTFSAAWSKHLWGFGTLKRGKLKDFQGVKPRSHPFLITCFLHTQYFLVLLMLLLLPWSSFESPNQGGWQRCHLRPHPLCLLGVTSHLLNSAEKWIQHSCLAFRELSSSGSPGQMMAWLVSVQSVWF